MGSNLTLWQWALLGLIPASCYTMAPLLGSLWPMLPGFVLNIIWIMLTPKYKFKYLSTEKENV